MKKSFFLFVCLVIISSSFVFASPFNGGDGSSSNPYQIYNETQLLALINANNSSTWNAHYILTHEITCSSSATATIGNNSIHFRGTFNGQGFFIKNLIIHLPTNDFIGLFGYTESATITNLNLSNISISGRQDVGGMFGLIDASSIVSNCSVSGTIIGDDIFIGGFVGNINGGSLSNCTTSITVTGARDVGGFVGYSRGLISNCSSSGIVYGTSSSTDAFGGFVGAATLGSIANCNSSATVYGYAAREVGGFIGGCGITISNCYAIGNVSSNDAMIGGFAGGNYWTLDYCYATGDVSSTVSNSEIGGLVGHNESIISNCHATGNVTGVTNVNQVGGLVGYNLWTITNSYATGTVTGYEYVGGLVGENEDALISYCIATGNATGSYHQVGGFVGYNNRGTITFSNATGNATATNNGCGGFAGCSAGIISDCYSLGNASGISSIGGFVGYTGSNSGTYINCYSIGTVTASGTKGGFCGTASTMTGSSSFTCCYWNTNTTGLSDGVGDLTPDPSGITGLSTAQMHSSTIFIDCGWSTSNWSFGNGSFPQLQNMPSILTIVTTPTLTEWSRYILIFSVLLVGCYFVYRKIYA